jgi:hypothetical protein
MDDKKLLIVGGDSWSNPKENCYQSEGIDIIWPEMVAEFLDWDIINVSEGGAGNDWISGQILDAVEENQHRDIVVMALWSQAIRIVPFDLPYGQFTFNIYSPDLRKPIGPLKQEIQDNFRDLFRLHVYDPDAPPDYQLTKEQFWMKVANQSLRYIFHLNNYCQSKNIPIIHHRALHTLAGIEWMLKKHLDFEARKEVFEVCKENYYYKKILEWKNIVGDPDFFKMGSSCFDMYEKYYISRQEKHPNTQGHMLIANSFVNKYIELYEEKSTAEPDYVYD